VPNKLRVSLGSALVLRLIQGRMDAEPTTVYLLSYRKGRCFANCGFCPQARRSEGRVDMLSRVTWPPFPTLAVITKIEEAFRGGTIKRVCIQALNYPTVFEDLLGLIGWIRFQGSDVPISVCCQPVDWARMEKLREAGIDRIGIPLDAATKVLFDRVKGQAAGGPYVWEAQLRVLRDAVQVFGRSSVTTHLIVGLGENEKEMIQRVQWCVDAGIYPSLFSFTPIRGTALEGHPQPSISHYRRIQMARHLIVNQRARYENMKFDEKDRLANFDVSEDKLKQIIRTGAPFLTSGCPGCNRPYYNERPGGPLYNFPRQPLPEEILEIEREMGL
jgi:biotin synthase-related radical SAM superfamily protein